MPVGIAELVAAGAARTPDLAVLGFEHEGAIATRSYRDLWERGCALALQLRQRGLAAGDRLALVLQNHPEFVEAMVASALLGVTFVPIDARTRGERLAHLLRHCGCSAALVGDYALDAVLRAAAAAPALQCLLLVGDDALPLPASGNVRIEAYPDLAPQAAATADFGPVDPSMPMQILYTSGTTGDPKGVIIRHDRYRLIAAQGAAIYDYRPHDRLYTGLSLTHGNAQFVTLTPALHLGLPAIISRRFSKSRFWSIIRAQRCTCFSLLGGMATALYAGPPRADDADNPARLVTSAGMPAALWEDFEQRFGVRIAEYYGAVEGGHAVKPVGEGPIGSCGRVPAALAYRIVDESGGDVLAGTPGEILFRPADGSPAVVEYFDDPDAAARKTAGGWLHSGDVVHRDADGWLFFHHRAGAGIRRNGDFIDPAPIMRRLALHPAVSDVHVYGTPAANGAPGEKDVVAAVVLRAAGDASAAASELLEWCRAGLDRQSVPSHIQFVTSIPKTASEKPQEHLLAQQLRGSPRS